MLITFTNHKQKIDIECQLTTKLCRDVLDINAHKDYGNFASSRSLEHSLLSSRPDMKYKS